MPTIAVDTLSLYLGGLCLLLLLLHVFLVRPSSPLLHPILLGRQAESARVRRAQESAVWHHASATSPAMLVARPTASVKSLVDIVEAFQIPPQQRIQIIAQRLSQALKSSERTHGTVGVLVSDSNLLVALLAAFAYLPQVEATVLPSKEALLALGSGLGAIVSDGDLPEGLNQPLPCLIPASPLYEDLESTDSLPTDTLEAFLREKTSAPPPSATALTFGVSIGGKWTLVPVTNMNLTASVYNITQIFGSLPHIRINDSDRVGLYYSPSTPFGFSAALATLYAQAQHRVSSKTDASSVRAMLEFNPSVLFIYPAQARKRIQVLKDDFAKNTPIDPALAPYFWNCKRASLRDGVLDPKTVTDRIALNSFRHKWRLGGTRALAVFAAPGEELTYDELDALRALYNAPVVQALIHPTQPFALTASHMHDFQLLGRPGDRAHAGPPGINVAIKLKLEDDGADLLQGSLWVESPAVAVPKGGAGDWVAEEKGSFGDERWFKTGYRVQIYPNGVVKTI